MPLCFEKKHVAAFLRLFNECTSGLQLGDNFSIFFLLYGLVYGM